jgi:hypothetical protein
LTYYGHSDFRPVSRPQLLQPFRLTLKDDHDEQPMHGSEASVCRVFLPAILFDFRSRANTHTTYVTERKLLTNRVLHRMLHTVWRAERESGGTILVDGEDVIQQVREVLDLVKVFTDGVSRSGEIRW